MKIGLYIHWPFCVKKCHYCDLNSHVRSDADYIDYVNAICDEMNHWQKLRPDLVVQTIFFGGGTPSLMKPEWIERILNNVNNWQTNLREITLEANPSLMEFNTLHELHSIGINRISFGVQSFDDNLLQYLGRTHSAHDAIEIITKANQIFDRVSLDLMYYLPGQTTYMLNNSIDTALQLGTTHISWYSLTIEQNTLFGKLFAQNKLTLPSDDVFCEQYQLIYDRMESSGLHQYELSNFAKPGYESLHNLIYWEYQDFLGIGPGAHSRLTGLDFQIHEIANYKLPEKWLQSVKSHQYGVEVDTPLTTHIAKQEEFMMKLRLNKGISIQYLRSNFTDEVQQKLVNLSCSNDIIMDKTGFRLTSKGFMRYNSVLKYLASHML